MNKKNEFDYIASYLLNKYLGNNNETILKLCAYNDETLYTNLIECFKKLITIEILESLVYEYHFMKDNNILKGENRRSRMVEFKKIINNSTYIENFLKKYVNLDKLLSIKINDLYEETVEILTNFFNDCKKLNEIFNLDLGKIIDINFSQGDLHCGKTVCIVKTTKTKIVYKPRNALAEQMLKELFELSLSLLERKVNFKYPLYYSGTDYLWQQFIDYKTCNNLQEVKDFYYKSGIYLAIFYVLGSTDLHYENLVANGEHPMFIDLETLINGIFNNDSYKQKYRDLNSSVLRTAMLPIIDSSSTFDINMSALFTGNKVSKTMYGTVLLEDEENDWIFANVPYQAQSTNNIITLDNEIIEPEIVSTDLITGFRDTLNLMISNKNSYLKIFNDNKYSKMKIRQLLRPTRVYSKFLSASKSPEAFKSVEKYEEIFDILIDNFSAGKFGYLRVEKEIESLKKGYIPSFYVYYNDLNLYYDNVLVCKNYYFKSPQDTIKQKLLNLDKALIDYQTRLIEFSLATSYEESNIFTPNTFDIKTNKYWEKEDLISKTNDYFENYLNYVIYPNEGEITMETLNINSTQIQLELMNSGLYNDGGTILLLALFGKKYNFNIEIISKKMLASLISQYRYDKISDIKSLNFSVFSGLGGLVYLSYNFYKIFKNEYYLEFYKEIRDDCIEYLIKNYNIENIDYLNGISGLIYLLTQIYIDNKYAISIEKLNQIINTYIEYITKNYINYKKNGLAHGISGIAITLLNIFKIYKNENIKNLCINVLNIENDIISTNNINNYPMTWCNGIIGMMYVRDQVYSYLNIKDIENDNVMNLVNSLITNKQYDKFFEINSFCMCHGLYGNIENLRKMHLTSKNKMLQELFLKKHFNSFNDIKWLKLDMKFDSFMLGTSGVIYSLLSIYENYPSILNLEIYTEE